MLITQRSLLLQRAMNLSPEQKHSLREWRTRLMAEVRGGARQRAGLLLQLNCQMLGDDARSMERVSYVRLHRFRHQLSLAETKMHYACVSANVLARHGADDGTSVYCDVHLYKTLPKCSLRFDLRRCRRSSSCTDNISTERRALMEMQRAWFAIISAASDHARRAGRLAGRRDPVRMIRFSVRLQIPAASPV